ncbi:hypothetical protein FA95DRAFT_1599993, partial [Auriscalpium vulgare]
MLSLPSALYLSRHSQPHLRLTGLNRKAGLIILRPRLASPRLLFAQDNQEHPSLLQLLQLAFVLTMPYKQTSFKSSNPKSPVPGVPTAPSARTPMASRTRAIEAVRLKMAAHKAATAIPKAAVSSKAAANGKENAQPAPPSKTTRAPASKVGSRRVSPSRATENHVTKTAQRVSDPSPRASGARNSLSPKPQSSKPAPPTRAPIPRPLSVPGARSYISNASARPQVKPVRPASVPIALAAPTRPPAPTRPLPALPARPTAPIQPPAHTPPPATTRPPAPTRPLPALPVDTETTPEQEPVVQYVKSIPVEVQHAGFHQSFSAIVEYTEGYSHTSFVDIPWNAPSEPDQPPATPEYRPDAQLEDFVEETAARLQAILDMVAGVGDPVNPADDYNIYVQARGRGDVGSRTISESSSASLPSQSVWKGSAGSLDSVSTVNSTVVSVLLPSVSEKEALNAIVCLDNTSEAPVFDLPAG